MQTFWKDSDASLDYYVDWSAWMTTGDTITGSSWVAESGITVEDSSVSGDVTCVWLSGGTLGETYEVTNSITTVGDGVNGRKDDRTIKIVMVEK